MREIKFRVWYYPEKKMYYRGYQKLFHVLLCREGGEADRGIPVRRASHADCELLEGTGIEDCRGREIFEGDVVRVQGPDKTVTDEVESVPDMFRSRGLHPLDTLLKRHGLDSEAVTFEIIGNRFENPELLEKRTL